MNTIKKLLIFLLFLASFANIGLDYSYADECASDDTECNYNAEAFWSWDRWGNTEASWWRTIEVIVTEEMPGLDCVAETELRWTERDGIQVWTGRYKCQVPVWMEWALLVLGRMIRFLTSFALISAVLFLVFNGMRLTTAWIDPEAKGKVKSQIMMTLGGIILLLLSGPILRLIAPWVYR